MSTSQQRGAVSTAAAAQTNHLATGTLNTWDAIAISVSVLAPGMAMLLNVPAVAATAGGSTPLAFLLGGVACLTLAFVVIGFTRRLASAGYAYTYASRSLGKEAGFIAGWLYAFGLICFVPMTMAGVGALTADLLHLSAGWWFPFFLIGMALLIVLSIVKIKVTTRLQLVVGALTVLVILIVNVAVTAKGGVAGQSLAPFTFGHTLLGGFKGVFYGIILGVTSYIGFETAADFGEETANPRRSIPIAIIAATAFAILLYLWTTYATAIGFGVDNGKDWAGDGFALKTIAAKFVGGPLPALIELGAMLSAFIVCVGCATAGTRTLFAMGREGVLPSFFGRTHPRFQTPANATFTVGIVATLVAVFVGYGMPSDTLGAAFTVYALLATIGTLAVIIVYIMLCLGGIIFFRRTETGFNPVLHGLVPLVGAVIFAAAWYGSVAIGLPHPLNYSPYVAGLWLLLGIAALLYLKARRPESVARIGSILGEEGGQAAELLDR